LQVESRRIQKEKQQLLEEKRRLVEEKRLIRDQVNRSNYLSYHRRCGHANMKSLDTFKRHGKVTASRLPPKFLRNYRKDCPICVAMKKRRKSLPKGLNFAHDSDDWIISCRGKRSILIVVASSDVKAIRGTTTSQCLYVLKQAIRLPFPMSNGSIFRWSTSNSPRELVDTQGYFTVISLGNHKHSV
jgi:hypothetical protein